MKSWPLLFVSALLAAQPAAPKVLLVVAHPDDEYYFAATVYRIAKELHGVVDQVVITNGEGGYRYSTLAERVYGVPLTDEATGRRQLPAIRKKETLAAGRVLGIRRHYFLNERDQKFTLDAREAIDQVWNCGRVRKALRELLAREHYGFVFTVLPRGSEHGHHQAATRLALEVVREMDAGQRPAVLGAEPGRAQETPVFVASGEGAVAATSDPKPAFAFDRHQRFGFRHSLGYDIVVHWMIAEHKSQGLFQNDVAKHDLERFWTFSIGPADASARTAALAKQLQLSSGEEPGKVAIQ